MFKKLVLSSVFGLCFSAVSAAEEIHYDSSVYQYFNERPFLMAINRPEGSRPYQFLDLVYQEIFNRLDIQLDMEYLPLKRGFIEVINGKFDGETSRVLEYGDKHETLIRVSESLYSTNLSAFTIEPDRVDLNGWDSLKETDYKVEYPHGVVISEINLKKVVKPKNLTNVTTAEQGIKKLMLGRTDLYIGDDLVVYPLLESLKTEYDVEVFKAGIMKVVPLYMYIHEKNAFMEPIFSQVIKDMKEEGIIDEYRKQVFGI